jgi:hypothetical protein
MSTSVVSLHASNDAVENGIELSDLDPIVPSVTDAGDSILIASNAGSNSKYVESLNGNGTMPVKLTCSDHASLR